MRRYPIGRQKLLDDIEVERPRWLKRAEARTAQYVADGDYTGGKEFWSEIKAVYIRLQHEKCAYCETRLQGAAFAIKVHEVEHFRPKQSVKAWPSPSAAHLQGFVPPGPVGSASPVGYYKLAYHPFNYAIACTRCNSTLKSNYFPVGGPRQTDGHDPSLMHGEKPLLVYPISDIDDDPEELITFEGVLAVPKRRSGPDRDRALVTIAFFQLNHQDLTTRRAESLAALWLSLEAMAALPAGHPMAAQYLAAIDRACAPGGEFSACMRAFRDLHGTRPDFARQLGEAANTLTPA
ncbi:hypothetical protein [Mitsuaria sp. GD03876]|uniref:hypothetical protein n=1 Tax=Mitsuaria sp. GD03876 TaxID=2975399 RepID=UPI00244A145D|nr:hypothetical protein [Mitsuaria sp. GD03876]MDH0864250.1 hypothetical protein [Mitsuaria sp. GD03876]